jgi:hypothetical protein
MKVTNFESPRTGNPVANQFIITDGDKTTFQSYRSIIAVKEYTDNGRKITLDRNTWDYSVTTGKYRNEFLGEGIADTRKKIESGEYKLADLN